MVSTETNRIPGSQLSVSRVNFVTNDRWLYYFVGTYHPSPVKMVDVNGLQHNLYVRHVKTSLTSSGPCECQKNILCFLCTKTYLSRRAWKMSCMIKWYSTNLLWSNSNVLWSCWCAVTDAMVSIMVGWQLKKHMKCSIHFTDGHQCHLRQCSALLCREHSSQSLMVPFLHHL